MTGTAADEDREIEVWNRAAGGEPASDRQGDQALAHALVLLGHAEGDGLLSAIEHEHDDDEPYAGRGASALLWFGLADAARLVDEITDRWVGIVDGDLDAVARERALEELEPEADRRFAALDLEGRLQLALRSALAHRPEHFADEPDLAGSAAPVLAGDEERPGWAVRIPPEQKLRRTAQAYEAFGIRAEVHDGQLVIWPPDDAGWDVVDEVTRLLDQRYPEEDEG